MHKRMMPLLLVLIVVVLAACGTPSKEDVLKKLSGKWNDAKGYELEAIMEINTGAEPRVYDVEVWHTKPDFYRVNVTQGDSGDSQMIVRNEDGVFVVAPSLGKTYKFQSDWPKENSQGYLIGALSEDIKADSEATMVEEDDTYIFATATRNNHKKVLPTQEIHIDQKTLLPKHVSIFDENKEEQIKITFNKISLGTERKANEYAVDMNEQKSDKEEPKAESEAEEEEQPENDDGDVEEDKNANNTSLNTYYPTVQWEGVALVEEKAIKNSAGVRTFMTFGETKKYTIVQEPATVSESTLPVSLEGDPVDLGFAVAAITDTSLRWESDGILFFIASDSLSREEMIEVALSMSPEEMK